MSSIVKQSSIIGIGRIAIAVIIFLSDAILSRHLGVIGKGEYFYVYNLIFTSSIILTGGIEYGNFYYFSRSDQKQLLLNSLAYLLMLAICIFTFGSAILNQFPNSTAKITNLTTLITLGIVLETFSVVLILFLLATGKTIPYVVSRIIRRGLFLFCIVAFFITKSNATVHSCITIYIVSISAGISFIIWQLRSKLPSNLHIDTKLLKNTLYYGIKTHVGMIAEQLHRRFGIFFLGFFSTTASVGIYSVAIGIGELSLFVSNAASIALLSRTNIDKDKLQKETSLITRHTTLLALLSSALLFIIGKFIILFFFGESFSKSYDALLLILPGILLYSFYASLKSYLINSGKSHIATMCGLFGLAINVILNFCFLPVAGFKSAAFSLSCSYGLSSLLILILTAKFSHEKILSYIVLNTTDIEQLKHNISRILKR